MKNITLKIDDETYRKARVRAAEQGTSVSAMVRDFLVRQAGEEDERKHAASPHSTKFTKSPTGAVNRASEPLKPLTRDEIYAERLR